MATNPNDLWENDPSLIERSPEYWKGIRTSTFEWFYEQGAEPGDEKYFSRASPEFRKQYAEWYKAKKAQTKD